MSMIKVENLTFSYPSSYDPIFENVSFQIDTDWKLGFVGRNGRGKTTFLNLLMDQYEYRGKIIKSVRFDYFPYLVKDTKKWTMEVLNEVCPQAEEWQIRKELYVLGVDEEVLWRPFETLSNGEQTKVLLAALFLNEGHFLLIDEPTNHLDITSKEILERALNDYTGTILYVSHDRYFINQTATRILELTGNTFVNYIGNYDYYLEKKDLLTPAVSTAASEDAPAQVSESKLSWQEQKEEQARLRKRQNDLKKTEERIGVLETRNGKIDELMMQEEVYTNSVKCQELAKEKTAIEVELEELYEKWEELAE